MIEEAVELETYLPLSYGTSNEQAYIRFLWDTFSTNTEHGKFQFAFLAFHMIVMSFVYFNIWQIKLIRPKDFETAMIGFGKDVEKNFLSASSPFVFSAVNERTVLRLLKLIQCDNSKIGTYAKLVDDRNDTAHANGNIFFNTEEELTKKIRDVMRAVEEIQGHSEDIIRVGYKEFLLNSRNLDEREFTDNIDQIQEVLVKQLYMSSSDIAFCKSFEIEILQDEVDFETMRELHDTLTTLYPANDDEEVVA